MRERDGGGYDTNTNSILHNSYAGSGEQQCMLSFRRLTEQVKKTEQKTTANRNNGR